MATDTTYTFSFTTVSLNLDETVMVAHSMLEDREIDATTQLGGGEKAVGEEKLQEYLRRIRSLTPEQLNLLAYGDIDSQRQIAYLAICKTYGFIRDFVIEVLGDKVSSRIYEIHHSDFPSFYQIKAVSHPIMETFTENQREEIRLMLFQILTEAKIIETIRSKKIKLQSVKSAVMNVILNDDPMLMKLFMKSDLEIKFMR